MQKDEMLRACWIKNLGAETITLKCEPGKELYVQTAGFISPVMFVQPGSIVCYPHWYILPVSASGRPGNWIRGFSREAVIELDIKMRHDTHSRIDVKGVEKSGELIQ